MVKTELNRFWKLLYKRHQNNKSRKDDWYEWIETTFKPEFRRLYFADKEFKDLNANSIKIAIVLNRKYNIIPHHRFGLDVDESIKY